MLGVTRLEAPAKLTLALQVAGVRDDGYHLIVAEMASLDLCDVVDITEADESSVTVDGPYADGVPTDGTNLVLKALQLAGRTARVHVTKNVPNGGGLGGGSSDAAAVLRWAGYADLRGASRVGADIPFCMFGGRALVMGIGEEVRPLPFAKRDITLVIPPLHVPTPAVYRMWDEMGGPRSHPVNHLTEAAIAVEPRLADWQRRITDAAGAEPVLAGSGATWFLHGHHPAIAGALAGAAVITTNTRPA
mgnify:FL=1